jgi:hypothetical protein
MPRKTNSQKQTAATKPARRKPVRAKRSLLARLKFW